MVKDLIRYYNSGYKIYTNFPLFSFLKDKHTELDNKTILSLIINEELEPSPNGKTLLCIDEIQTIFDSRKSMKKENLDFSYFIQQIGKRDITLLFTTQLIGTVDLRIRHLVHSICEPEMIILPSKRAVCYCEYNSIYNQRKGIYLEPVTMIYDPKPIFGLYDTRKEQISTNLKIKEKQ